jgi:hypothetical protein
MGCLILDNEDAAILGTDCRRILELGEDRYIGRSAGTCAQPQKLGGLPAIPSR